MNQNPPHTHKHTHPYAFSGTYTYMQNPYKNTKSKPHHIKVQKDQKQTKNIKEKRRLQKYH